MTTITLQHSALPFRGADGFVSAAADVVREAIAYEAVPIVLADPDQISDVRSEIGPDGPSVFGFDMSVAGRNPARLLPALQHFLDQHPDQQLACVAEPIRVGDPAAVVGEVALHELLLRLPAFHAWNCRLTCAYDVDGLAPEVVSAIENAHRGDADPADQIDRARAESLPPRPMSCEDLGVDRTTLSTLRGFIQRRAQRAGLDDERVDDLVYAVNEVVTNSICHGEGRARVSFWTEANAVICEVRDRGYIRDPLAGRVAPQPDRAGGRGLWLVNQLCDFVQLRSSPAGTILRMHIDT
jgi:anti-sigma regulatory factor (Ser/Thr protein kinase)